MSRAATVLARFPAHLGADRPGTLLAEVVAALAAPLDVQTSQLGRVRAAHRLGQADSERDLLLLAGLHGLGPETVALLHDRTAAVRALADVLADPRTPPAERAAALARLPELLAVPAEALGATADAVAALRRATSHTAELDLVRGALRQLVATHRRGGATVAALLDATAAYLGLEVETVTHLEQGTWHVARCRDRLRASRPSQDGPEELLPAPDLVALEENPFRPQAAEPVPRRTGDRFRVLRGGFDTVPVTVRVLGVEDRTVAPQVVNVDAGRGVLWTGRVPDGAELRFESDGRITLEGVDVTRLGWSFAGAVFASAGERSPSDAVFADEAQPAPGQARFVVSSPLADAYGPDPVLPHAGGLVDPLPLPVGESRWALFVGEGAFGGGADRPAVPSDRSAFATGPSAEGRGSVFADADGAPPPAALVGLAWQEREPFAVRVWLPLRLAALDDDPDRPPLRTRLRALLDRHRAAGVHVHVEHADDRWTLGTGVLRRPGSDEPVGGVVLGTRLWPSDQVPS